MVRRCIDCSGQGLVWISSIIPEPDGPGEDDRGMDGFGYLDECVCQVAPEMARWED